MDEEQKMGLSVIPDQPYGIEALRRAIDFVARGVPLDDQMVDALTRMLADHQSRIDLVQTAMMHFQMGRLMTVLRYTQLAEDLAFSPARMNSYGNKELIEVVKVCHAEAKNITGYLDEKSSKPMKSSEANVKEIADPDKAQQKKEAGDMVGSLSPLARKKITALLEKAKMSGDTVTEVG